VRVKIEFVLDVNERAWMMNYDVSKSGVRADVRNYVEYGATEHLREMGLLAEPKPVHHDQAMRDRTEALR
jgi:hypothetical protein